MARDIEITRITSTSFAYEIADMELEEQLGFDTVYRKGGRLTLGGGILTIETSVGISGIASGGIDSRPAQYLLGRNPLDREIIWHDLKRSRRGLDVELHGGSLAQRHIMATLRNANYYELGLVHPLVSDTKPAVYPERRWLDELDSVDENGCVEVPEGPGLGVAFDRDWIENHKTGEMVYE